MTNEVRATVFTVRAALNFSSVQLRHELGSVTNSKHWKVRINIENCRKWRAFLMNAEWTSRKNYTNTIFWN